MRRSPLAFILTLALVAFITDASRVVRADNFYQGKRITLVVGYNPGGGIDTAGRLMAKHLGRFIPGNPSIIVQNMEGGAGVIAANYIARATPDGLTLAVPGRTWFIVGVVKHPAAKFEPAALSYVGSTGTVNSALWMRPDSGITSFEKLMASREKVILGSLNATSQDSMVPMLLAQNGVPVRVIRGYNSSARLLVAAEQGELPGLFHIVDGFAKRPDLLTKKVLVPILQTQPVFEGLPLVRDVIRASDRPLLDLVLAGEDFGVILAGPPGVPAGRLDLLRKAFIAMTGDAEFQSDSSKMDVPRGSPLDGTTVASMMAKLVRTTTPETIAGFDRLKE
jgi:Tripartite tricarboxylate transporter family receptor